MEFASAWAVCQVPNLLSHVGNSHGWYFDAVSKKLFLYKWSSRFSPVLSSRSFIILDFTLKSLTHFELILLYIVRYVQIKVHFCIGTCWVVTKVPLQYQWEVLDFHRHPTVIRHSSPSPLRQCLKRHGEQSGFLSNLAMKLPPQKC